MRDDLKNTEAKGRGVRFSAGKLPFRLLPWDAIIELTRVYLFGATSKYSPRNWEKGLSYEACFDSMMRHAIKWYLGRDLDKETGLHHMAHAAWNALAIVTFHLRGMGKELDDRGCKEGDGNSPEEAARWRALLDWLEEDDGGPTSLSPQSEESSTQESPQTSLEG